MISGIFTIAAMLGFIGVSWWAYTRHNRARFEEAARLPLEDEPVSCAQPGADATRPCCCQTPGGTRQP